MNVELANSWTEKTGRNKDEPEKLPSTTKYTRCVYAAVLGDIKVTTGRINGFSGWSEIRSGIPSNPLWLRMIGSVLEVFKSAFCLCVMVYPGYCVAEIMTLQSARLCHRNSSSSSVLN